MKQLTMLTILLASWGTQAQQSDLRTQFQASAMPVDVMLDSAKPRFGAYQLESNLVVVPSSLVNPSKVEMSIATLSITRSETATSAVTDFSKNAVVRHLLTGELGILTGQILVQLKANSNRDQLLSRFGLTLVKEIEDTDLVVLAPTGDRDLAQLTNELRKSGQFQQVQLDILDNRNKPW